MEYTRMIVGGAIRHNEKLRPLVIALLETAATQGATLSEFRSACKYAVEIVENEMSQSNVCIEPFARRGIVGIEAL